MRKFFGSGLLVAAILAQSPAAQAACEATEMEGPWQLTATMGDGGEIGAFYCPALTLQRVGTKYKVTGTCNITGGAPAVAAGGPARLRVTDNCKLRGSFLLFLDGNNVGKVKAISGEFDDAPGDAKSLNGQGIATLMLSTDVFPLVLSLIR